MKDIEVKTGIAFPKESKLLHHIRDDHEQYEEWLLLCPKRKYSFPGIAHWVPSESTVELISERTGIDDIGAVSDDKTMFWLWETTSPCRASVTSTDRGDYVIIEKTRKR